MAAVQNFSLPGRTGQAHPVSPAWSPNDDDQHDQHDPAPPPAPPPPPVDRGLVRYHAHTVGSRPSLGTRVFSPSPSAVQLFRFSDEQQNDHGSNNNSNSNSNSNNNNNDHPADPPRPLSTASAPALPTAGSISSHIAWGLAVALSPSQASVGQNTDRTLHGNMDDSREKDTTNNKDRTSRPISSITSWPWPPPSPPASSSASANNTERAASQPGPMPTTQATTTAGGGEASSSATGTADRDQNGQGHATRLSPNHHHLSADPPALVRSISVRWGPNDRRHVSLEPGQSADDVARAVAAHRRHRRVVLALLVVSGAGALSTAGAIATAAVQANEDANANADAGVDAHPALHGGTLGWLIASLVVSVGAVCCCFLYVVEEKKKKSEWPWSWTWWKTPGPSEQEGVLQDIAEEEEAEGRAPETTTTTTHWWQQRPRPLSCLLRPRHDGRRGIDTDDNNDDNGGDEHNNEDGWVEMDNLGASAGIWETPTVHEQRRIPQLWRAMSTKTQTQQSVKGKEAERTGAAAAGQSTVDAETGAAPPPPPPIPDEDRNWAKFAGDPVQLRRYVESLEARLAVAEGRCQQTTTEEAAESHAAEEADAGPSSSAGLQPTPTPPPTPPQLQPQPQSQLGRALTSGVLRTQPSTDSTDTLLLPVIGGLSYLTDPDESSNSLLLLLPRRHSSTARLSSVGGGGGGGRDMDFAVASGRRMLEAVVAAAAAAAAGTSGTSGASGASGTSGTLVEMGSEHHHSEEARPNRTTMTTASGTQNSILTQLYAAYGEERGAWRDRRERREREE